jgi:hypothetical protein
MELLGFGHPGSSLPRAIVCSKCSKHAGHERMYILTSSKMKTTCFYKCHSSPTFKKLHYRIVDGTFAQKDCSRGSNDRIIKCPNRCNCQPSKNRIHQPKQSQKVGYFDGEFYIRTSFSFNHNVYSGLINPKKLLNWGCTN